MKVLLWIGNLQELQNDEFGGIINKEYVKKWVGSGNRRYTFPIVILTTTAGDALMRDQEGSAQLKNSRLNI